MQFSDNFNRADNADIGTTWTPYTTRDMQIVGNEARPTTADVTALEWYNGTAPGAAQFAQVGIVTITSGEVGCLVLANQDATLANRTFYAAYAATRGIGETTAIVEVVAGSITAVASENATTWVPGDVIRFSADAGNLTVYRNGVSVLTAPDATITSGTVGMYIYNQFTVADSELDNFVGGDLFTPSEIVLQAVKRGAFY